MGFNAKSFLTLASLALLACAACGKAPRATNEVVAVAWKSIPLNPGDALWDKAPEHTAALLLQDVVDPRLMQASTREVKIRAAAHGSAIAFRLQWTDANKDDMPGPGLSVDSCAVQLPVTISTEPPSPQMGEANRPVDVTFWRADWQASTDGRGDGIRALYPNAAVDHYPYQAQSLSAGSSEQREMTSRYAPAQALGNRRGGPRESPVEDMVASGPGTLKTEVREGSKGKGVRTKDGWLVVLQRRLPAGLAPQVRTQVAFAVWEGSQGESGSRKMRTGWIPLLRQGAP
jgi:DMSO reductase family type II enzyme heme b subunit